LEVTNAEAVTEVKEDRQILYTLWQQKYRLINQVLRHGDLLHEAVEELRMS